MADEIRRFLESERLPESFANAAARLHLPLARRLADLAQGRERPLVAGVCGPQGSGKSTLADLVARLLEVEGLSCAVLSIDDLYRTRAERAELARTVHPLLATRGVPGTHDVALGLSVLDALARPSPVALPRFVKAADDRAPRADWPVAQGPVDVVLLEGWCVGARPQPAADLAAPVNALERDEDPDGAWRGFADAALSGDYQDLFGRIDHLTVMTPPDFATVRTWRGQQEAKLRQRLEREGRDLAQTMDDAALDRFLAHYQRLTEWIARDLPDRAEVAVSLDAERRPAAVRGL